MGLNPYVISQLKDQINDELSEEEISIILVVP